MTGLTLEAWSWLAIFVIGGGFLVTAAWLWETHEADPISPDRRNQAHPFDGLTRPLAEDRMMASVLSGSPVVDPPPESAAAG